MVNLRKRIEAINEMYLSEKAYISDLILWESEFRKCILNFPFLSLKVKYEICDLIFINMHEIRINHEDIFKEMKRRNLEVRLKMDPYYVEKDDSFSIDKSKYDDPNVLKLEYATMLFKYSRFTFLYEYYVSRLPKAEYELDRLCHYSPEFKMGLQSFLTKNNMKYLGTRNFLFRPSTKLARIPLLLKAIFKNEEDPKLKAQYELFIEKIKIVILKVDKHFKKYSEQFNIYRMSQYLKYSETVANQTTLGLFQKKRKLIKEDDFLMKPDIWSAPILVRMYIFDHCIIFCETSKSPFTVQKILYDPLFIDRLIFFDVNLGFNKLEDIEINYFPLFLLETGENKLRTILFEDYDSREIYKETLHKAQRLIKRKHNKQISLLRMNIITENIISSCKSDKYKEPEHNTLSSNPDSDNSNVSCINYESSTSSENLNTSLDINNKNIFKLKEFKRAVQEYTLKIKKYSNALKNTGYNNFNVLEEIEKQDEDSEEENRENISWIKKLCYRHEIFSHIINFDIEDNTENIEYLRKQNEMLIISTKKGIYKNLDGKTELIYDGVVKKVLYDSKYEILMFQTDNTLNICKFNYYTDSLEPISIKNNIGDFFYGTNTKGSYIATRNYGSSKSSLIYLFVITKEGKNIKIDLSRKLYVGFKVYNVIFILTKIIIACKDFEIVDMETLKTEEFLELYNPCLSMIFSLIPNSKANTVFTIDNNTFLVCFDSIGFYVDSFGRVKRTNIIFLWKNIPLDFRVYFNNLVVLTKNFIDVYDLKSGNLIFSDQMEGLKFVSGTYEVFLYDKDNFYKLII